MYLHVKSFIKKMSQGSLGKFLEVIELNAIDIGEVWLQIQMRFLLVIDCCYQLVCKLVVLMLEYQGFMDFVHY